MTTPKIYATPRKLMVAIIGVLFGAFLMVGSGMWYVNHEITKSNHAWCEIINSLDERYRALPADAAPEARVFARQIADLKRVYKC